jgi:hypothetical protein
MEDEIIKDNSSEVENSVESENFTIEFYDDYHIYGETNLFGFLMPKDIENNVSVEIDAKPYEYEIYDINNLDMWVWGGDAQTQRGYMVKFSDLSLGDHEVVIAYPGDSYYAENRLVKNITVHDEKDLTRDIEVEENIEILPTKNQRINIEGIEHTTGNFSLSIDGEKQNITFDTEYLPPDYYGARMYLKFDARNLSYGSHRYDLYFTGDEYFNQTSKNRRL